jgi:hypothetical protein
LAAARQKHRTIPKAEKMTPTEERAVAQAYKDLKQGRYRTFKNAEEYLKYLDTV